MSENILPFEVAINLGDEGRRGGGGWVGEGRGGEGGGKWEDSCVVYRYPVLLCARACSHRIVSTGKDKKKKNSVGHGDRSITDRGESGQQEREDGEGG